MNRYTRNKLINDPLIELYPHDSFIVPEMKAELRDNKITAREIRKIIVVIIFDTFFDNNRLGKFIENTTKK